MVDDKGKRGRHHGGCPCIKCVERRIINAAKAARLVAQPVVTSEVIPMAIDATIVAALAPNPAALQAYLNAQTVVVDAAPVVIEHVPAAAITAAPVAPAVAPAEPVVPPAAPAVVAPAAPAAPAVAAGVPIVVEIPFGNMTPRAKGFTQFEDVREIPAAFSVDAGHVRIGKLYVPPAALVGREGIVTITISIR